MSDLVDREWFRRNMPETICGYHWDTDRPLRPRMADSQTSSIAGEYRWMIWKVRWESALRDAVPEMRGSLFLVPFYSFFRATDDSWAEYHARCLIRRLIRLHRIRQKRNGRRSGSIHNGGNAA